MSQYNKISYIAAVAAAVIFVLNFPALAQTVNNLTVTQPPSMPSSDNAEPEVQNQQPVAAPTPLVHKQATTHKAVKHKAKKTKHKTTAHKKPVKKAAAHKAKKTKHKKKPAPKSPAKETHRVTPKPAAAVAAAVTPVKKSAPDASMAVVQKEPVAPPPSHPAGSAAGKTVAYDFCLGYDNCVQHRYEASIQNGKAYGAIVMQKDENGKWAEGKLDPTMMADLDRMAQGETDSHVERELTPAEKSEIAGHQGKMHAMLVSYIQAGVEKKEEIKNMLRQLKIRTLADLEAYDPRLAKHDVAQQCVNEISVGR